MPIYDFQCKDCGTVFSVSISYSDAIGCHTSCPCCRGENIKKLISNINVIFKGSGFYSTDKEKEKSNS